MNATQLTCPFCNAQVPEPSSARATCPRCGETFAHKPDVQPPQPAAGPTIPTDAGQFPPTDTRPRPTGRNLRVGAIVVGVMLLMAASGLTYALLTQDKRREHDNEQAKRGRRQIPPPEKRKREPLPPATPVAPKDLAGLGYLPEGTGLIAAVHVHEALTSPVADDLTRRSIGIGGFQLNLDRVKTLTGIPAEDFDHVVLGIDVIDKNPPPPIHLVARTRGKYNRERLLATMNASEKPTAVGKREVYEITLPIKVEASLWLVDDRTFVIGLESKKLSRVPETPTAGLTQLPKELREAITTRLAIGQPMWLAGHVQEWPRTYVDLLQGLLDGVPLLNKIDQVKTFAVGVVPDKPMKIQAAFRCADEDAAKKLESEELAPRAKKDPDSFKFGRDKEWLSAQWKVDQVK